MLMWLQMKFQIKFFFKHNPKIQIQAAIKLPKKLKPVSKLENVNFFFFFFGKGNRVKKFGMTYYKP